MLLSVCYLFSSASLRLQSFLLLSVCLLFSCASFRLQSFLILSVCFLFSYASFSLQSFLLISVCYLFSRASVRLQSFLPTVCYLFFCDSFRLQSFLLLLGLVFSAFFSLEPILLSFLPPLQSHSFSALILNFYFYYFLSLCTLVHSLPCIFIFLPSFD
jgi:hypothetical protein